MPQHETALDWFQRSRRRRQQQHHQVYHNHRPQQEHPRQRSSFSQILDELLFVKRYQSINTLDYQGTVASTASTTSGDHDPTSSSSPLIVLEGCAMAKSWIMIHMIHKWVTTTPCSVLILNGEARIQLGLLPLLQRTSHTGQSSSPSTANNNSNHGQDQPGNPTTNHHDTNKTTMHSGHQQLDNQNQEETSESTTRKTTAQDYMQRIHFGMGSVALLELVRYSCAAAATQKASTKTTTSSSTCATTTPLLLVWDEYPDDPDITRQLGRMIQSFPQLLSVVVAGKWSGVVAQRIQVERLKGECWIATVAGKRYDFRITIEGIV